MTYAPRRHPPIGASGYDPVPFTAACDGCGALIEWRAYMVLDSDLTTNVVDHCAPVPMLPLPLWAAPRLRRLP